MACNHKGVKEKVFKQKFYQAICQIVALCQNLRYLVDYYRRMYS